MVFLRPSIPPRSVHSSVGRGYNIKGTDRLGSPRHWSGAALPLRGSAAADEFISPVRFSSLVTRRARPLRQALGEFSRVNLDYGF